jgi:hypothetical protein
MADNTVVYVNQLNIEPQGDRITEECADAADVAPIFKELQANGITSLRAVAAAFNNRGIPTATGKGVWDATQVNRVLKRLAG